MHACSVSVNATERVHSRQYYLRHHPYWCPRLQSSNLNQNFCHGCPRTFRTRTSTSLLQTQPIAFLSLCERTDITLYLALPDCLLRNVELKRPRLILESLQEMCVSWKRVWNIQSMETKSQAPDVCCFKSDRMRVVVLMVPAVTLYALLQKDILCKHKLVWFLQHQAFEFGSYTR